MNRNYGLDYSASEADNYGSKDEYPDSALKSLRAVNYPDHFLQAMREWGERLEREKKGA